MQAVLMLEDDSERIKRFEAALHLVRPELQLSVHRNANDFIAAHRDLLSNRLAIICMDHDLLPQAATDPDPGDGRMASDYLLNCQACCSVLIHSTNAPAADGMLYSLQEAGWDAHRIAPIGQDWIEAYWLPTMTELLPPPPTSPRE